MVVTKRGEKKTRYRYDQKKGALLKICESSHSKGNNHRLHTVIV